MAVCILNSKFNQVFILFEEKIKHGAILIFDSSHQFINSYKIEDNNSVDLELPNIEGKYFFITYYEKEIIKKTLYITAR